MTILTRSTIPFIRFLILTILISSFGCTPVSDSPNQTLNTQDNTNIEIETQDNSDTFKTETISPVMTSTQNTGGFDVDYESEEEAMMTQITVQVSEDAARALHQLTSSTPESQEVLEIVQKLGVVLKPMHPGIEDPILITFFIIEVPNDAMADQVIVDIQQAKAIEGAYIEPRPALP